MKTLLLFILVSICAQLAMAETEFEVQPLSVKSQHEVIGVQTSEGQHHAIIFTGKQAQKIAQAANRPFNPSSEMLVMTGAATTALIVTTLGATYTAGKLVLITSGLFAYAGVKIALGALYAGGAVAWLGITTAVTAGKLAVFYTLKGLQSTYYVATGVGLFAIAAPAVVAVGTLEFICKIPEYFSFGLLKCPEL